MPNEWTLSYEYPNSYKPNHRNTFDKICENLDHLSFLIREQNFINDLKDRAKRCNNLEKFEQIRESYESQKYDKEIENCVTVIKDLIYSYKSMIEVDSDFDYFIDEELKDDLIKVNISNRSISKIWNNLKKPNRIMSDEIKNGCKRYQFLSDQFIDIISIWDDKINIPQKIILS